MDFSISSTKTVMRLLVFTKQLRTCRGMSNGMGTNAGLLLHKTLVLGKSHRLIGMAKQNRIPLTSQQDATGRRQEEPISIST
jgi:hypothetical protein